MNDSCLDNVNVSVPETDVVKEVPVVTAMNELEKEVSGSGSGGVNVVLSKNKKKKSKRSSAECGVNSIAQDNVSVSNPETGFLEKVQSNLTISVLENEVLDGVNNVESKKSKRKRKKEALAGVESAIGVLEKEAEATCGVNSTMGVLEKEVLAGVNSTSGVLEKEVSAGVSDVVSKKKKRKLKRLDNASVGFPKTDDVEEVPVQLKLTSSPEKLHISPVDTTTGVQQKEDSGGVNVVASKKKKRKPKRGTMEMTCLDNVSVGIPKTDVLEEVPVQLNLASSPGKFQISPIDTTLGELEKEVSGGVNTALSKKKKRKPKRSSIEMTCLDNVSVGIPKTDAIEDVPVESNLPSFPEKFHISPVDTTNGVLEKEVSGGLDVVESKKKKRKPKRSTMEMSCLDNVSVGIPKCDAPEEVQVQLNLTSSCEKFHISPIDTTMGVLDKEAPASVGVNVVVSKKRKRKPKRLDNVSVGPPKSDALEEVPVESNLTSSPEKLHISPADTTNGVLEKEVLSGVDVVESKKRKRKPKRSAMEMTCLDNVSVGIPKTNAPEEIQVQLNTTSSCEKFHISPIDTTTGVLDKEVSVSAGLNDVVSKKRKRKPKRLDNVSVGTPKTDVLEDVPFESNLTSSPEKLHISPADTANGVLEKEVSSGVDVVESKKKKRKHKRSAVEMTCLDNVSVAIPKTNAPEEIQVQLNSTSSCEKIHISPIDTTTGVLDKEVSASAGLNDVVSKKRKRKPKRLDNVSVDAPKTDALEEVPVESNLTCSPEKLHISPVDTTMDVLEKEISGEVNAVVSNHSLDNVGVSITKTDVLEEVPVQLNLTSSTEKFHIPPVDTTMCVLEKEVSGGVSVLVSKKRKRKSKLKEMNDCSSTERTSLDNVSVKSVSGVTDNISLSDINNDVMANDHPVATCSINVDSNGKPEETKHWSWISSGMINPSRQLSQPLDTTTILKSRRKLLVLDVNGLLADIVLQCPKRFRPDFTLAKKKVFKRPFCDDFLQFCFEKFDVGIWSSRTKDNLTRAVDLLMKNMKHKLLFCWDASHCTKTGFKTLEDKHKPLVLKELKKLWENKAKCLPSQRGFYDETNTILLDDSPYKALRNPPYTAIHPKAYSFADVRDKSLGPDGDIRLYLSRVAEAENVQSFIQANPFGQKSITKAHPSWKFYSKLVISKPATKRNS